LGLYLKERVLFDDFPIDRVVPELPAELDPFVDCCRGHSSSFELLMKLLRVASAKHQRATASSLARPKISDNSTSFFLHQKEGAVF
jgi:hypothetical protein